MRRLKQMSHTNTAELDALTSCTAAQLKRVAHRLYEAAGFSVYELVMSEEDSLRPVCCSGTSCNCKQLVSTAEDGAAADVDTTGIGRDLKLTAHQIEILIEENNCS